MALLFISLWLDIFLSIHTKDTYTSCFYILSMILMFFFMSCKYSIFLAYISSTTYLLSSPVESIQIASCLESYSTGSFHMLGT